MSCSGPCWGGFQDKRFCALDNAACLRSNAAPCKRWAYPTRRRAARAVSRVCSSHQFKTAPTSIILRCRAFGSARLWGRCPSRFWPSLISRSSVCRSSSCFTSEVWVFANTIPLRQRWCCSVTVSETWASGIGGPENHYHRPAAVESSRYLDRRRAGDLNRKRLLCRLGWEKLFSTNCRTSGQP